MTLKNTYFGEFNLAQKPLIAMYLAVVFLLVPFPQYAVAEKLPSGLSSLYQCINILDDNKRLSCYDDFVRSKNQNSQEFDTSKIQWRVESFDALFDAEKKYSFYLQAQQAVKSKNQSVNPKLIVQCEAGKSLVEIQWDIYLGKNRISMQSRFDNDPITNEKWLIADSKRSVYFNGDSSGFIKKLMKHQKLMTKIRPHNGSPIVATFDIVGLENTVNSVSSECQW